MMAEPLHSRALMRHHKQSLDRRLRNRIIIGNVVGWIAILVLVHLLLF